MAEWSHPNWGEFSFQEHYGWARTIELQAFSKFRDGETKIEIAIDADSEDEIPTTDLVSVAEKTVANHKSLIESGVDLLWNDFHGNGPDSGMWWRGDVDHIYEILDGRFGDDVLGQPQGLYYILEKASLRIQGSGYGYDKPCSIIGFESPIDIEHGIGILTDGVHVIGLGYRSDPDAYLLSRR